MYFNNNFFFYGNDILKQTDGIAMGTNVAPVIANIYLAIKFDDFVKRLNSMHLFKRFIDDCFMIVNMSAKDFALVILPQLQEAAHPIKLTYTASDSSIDFLDLTIFRHNESIACKVFQKALNRYAYIPHQSFHPRATFKVFIYGEMLRYLKI